MIYTFYYSNPHGNGRVDMGDGRVDMDDDEDCDNEDWNPIGQVRVHENSIVITKNLIDVMSRFNDGWDYNYLNTDNPVLNEWLHSKPSYRSFVDWVASAQVRVSK